jgi:hypothetical protein
LTDIKALTSNTLSLIGYSVIEAGTYSEGDALPETYIAYQLIYDDDRGHYNNAPTSIAWRIQTTLYSKDPSIRNGAREALNNVMLPAGFLRVPGGRDLDFSKTTGHYAYTTDYRYISKL